MKKVVLSCVALSTLSMSIFSCSKPAEKIAPAQSQVGGSKTQNWYYITVAVAASAYIISKLAEGQYYSETIYDANGRPMKTVSGCRGVGSCKMSAKSVSTNNPLSSIDEMDVMPDYELNMTVIKNEDGKILMGVPAESVNSDQAQRFFYSNTIKFLSPGHTYTIDDPATLETLGLTEPIVINAGDFKVYNGSDGGRYIIVKE